MAAKDADSFGTDPTHNVHGDVLEIHSSVSATLLATRHTRSTAKRSMLTWHGKRGDSSLLHDRLAETGVP